MLLVILTNRLVCIANWKTTVLYTRPVTAGIVMEALLSARRRQICLNQTEEVCLQLKDMLVSKFDY